MVRNEIIRMQELNQYIVNVGGYSSFLYEDMVEETMMLLQEVLAVMPDRDQAMEIVLQKFRDDGSSSAIIYHLRLLAASWLKGHPDLEPFTQELGLSGYCSEWLERPNKEIDNLGIVLLSNVLLKDAGFVLEIAYLDRSPGSQVNLYRFPAEANDQDQAVLGPMMHLLYRPDHYDILYRHAPVVVEVHRAVTYAMPVPKAQGGSVGQLKAGPAATPAADYQTLDLLPLSDLPANWLGMGGALATGNLLMPVSEPPEPFPVAAAPAEGTWAVQPFPTPLSIRPASLPVIVPPPPPPSQPLQPEQQQQPQPQPPLQQNPSPPQQPKAKPQKAQKLQKLHKLQVGSKRGSNAGGGDAGAGGSQKKGSGAASLSPRSPQLATPSPNSAGTTATTTTPSDNPVRFSAWKHKFDNISPRPVDRDQPQFKTNTFKNSHFNVAHYNNPNFQPEPYRPGLDFHDTTHADHSPAASSSHDGNAELTTAGSRTKGAAKRSAGKGSGGGAASISSDGAGKAGGGGGSRRAGGSAGRGGGTGSWAPGSGGSSDGSGAHHQAKRRATRGGTGHHG